MRRTWYIGDLEDRKIVCSAFVAENSLSLSKTNPQWDHGVGFQSARGNGSDDANDDASAYLNPSTSTFDAPVNRHTSTAPDPRLFAAKQRSESSETNSVPILISEMQDKYSIKACTGQRTKQ